MNEIQNPPVKLPNRGSMLLILGVVIALGGLGIGWWCTDHPSFDRYSPALAAMQAHRISVDSDGRVDFSKDFPGLTPRNFALISWLDDGSFRVVFPTYHGEGAELSGLLYTSRPLREDDTRLRLSAVHFDQHVIQVGSYPSLLLDKKLNDNWYRVSYKLH